MEKGSEVMEDIVFRGVEFSVKIEGDNRSLMVEISDSVTADQWKGEFDPAYIEDLTRKTGNFKQFPIFCSMLESAVRKTSDSVTLDLLTYADLELLRNRKAGVVSRPRGHQQSSVLTAKRYLILIYTVEFDRIHYPLPLPYVGKPDPAALQKEIRTLRAELSAVTSHGVDKSAELEIQRLRAELTLVKDEKEAMAKVLERLQMTASGSIPGREDWRVRDVVRTLEDQLVKERAKSQRSASKRCQEQRLLMEQLEELRASECALRVRVKSLTSELALLRRGLDTLSVRVTPVSSHISSRGDREIYRSLSRERRSGYGTVRARSGSRERIQDRVQRSDERGRRADSSGPRARIPRTSPSPNGSRGPRFDPTAYIQDRQRRQKEAELKKQRKMRRDMLTSPIVPERGRSRSREAYPQMARSGSRGRSLSVERRGSRNSSESSLVDMDEMAKTLFRGRKQTYNGPTVMSDMVIKSRGGLLTRKPMCSTPTKRIKDKESSMDTGTELSEIDARLQALQEYMRDLDTGH
ncbi:centrosomal protein CCDC61 isoform X1 [Echeneis naucrates]|uniref:centrosomal protein CCDC61 isoform X1 n=1 Tax=Echeneis naucrates TaxID=173247 RepID=UPI00111427B8|nr:coiled-coil domain-containing protein 61 isoform X1 [Echeneis naucrates]XP_029376112.1 coiled-coil domain-containing protein 61 isoform X1 [Echeneis naucrates]